MTDSTTSQLLPPLDGEDPKTIPSTTKLVDMAGNDINDDEEAAPRPLSKVEDEVPTSATLNTIGSQPAIPIDDAALEKDIASASTPALTPAPEPEPTSGLMPMPPSSPAPPQLRLEVPHMQQTYITFLFLSGRRRLMNFDPDTTIGRVKELVWAAWSNAPSNADATASQQPAQEIEERPPAPSYLRVLHLGRMLQDDETLRDLKLPTHLPTSTPVNSPSSPGCTTHHHHPHAPFSTIMHLSIRPFPPPGEADSGKKAGRAFGRASDRTSSGAAPDPGDNANTGCCGCVVC